MPRRPDVDDGTMRQEKESVANPTLTSYSFSESDECRAEDRRSFSGKSDKKPTGDNPFGLRASRTPEQRRFDQTGFSPVGASVYCLLRDFRKGRT